MTAGGHRPAGPILGGATTARPGQPRVSRRAAMPNFEKYAWLFMHSPAVLLVCFGARSPVHRADVGRRVCKIDFSYVAQRWAPVLADLGPALLWLARCTATACAIIIGDYARKTPPSSG